MTVRQSPRPKIKVNFDGQILHGFGYMNPVATLVNQAAGVYFVDFSNVAGTLGGANLYTQSVGYDCLAISRYYNEFVYTSLQFEWIPNIAPGVADAGTQCYVSFIDNPEGIFNNLGAGVATQFSLAKNARNSKFFNAWERFVYNVPLTRRRKTFDTNYNYTADANTFDRAMQGAVIFGINSVSAAATLGQWRVTYTAELSKLDFGMAV